jgi:hypothetical protein
MIQLYQTLDLRPIGIPQTLRLSQYDSDFEIIFELTNFDGTWILDSGTTAEVQGTKTDGHGYSADAVFDDQLKTVTIAGDVQMTAAAGRNVFEVVLFHDGDRLGSKNFVLDVERAALDAETTASDSKIKNFTEMTEAATQAAETATEAAEAAEEAAATFSTDTTLMVPGKAADAKATGDAIAAEVVELNYALSGLESAEKYVQYNDGVKNGYAATSNYPAIYRAGMTVNINGTYGSSGPYLFKISGNVNKGTAVATVIGTPTIPLESGHKYIIGAVKVSGSITVPDGGEFNVRIYDSTITGKATVALGEETVIEWTDSNAALVVRASRDVSCDNLVLSVYVRDCTEESSVLSRIDGLEAFDESADDRLTELENRVVEQMPEECANLYSIYGTDYLTGKGFSGNTGNIVNSVNNVITGYIPVKAGDYYQIFVDGKNIFNTSIDGQSRKVAVYDSEKTWKSTTTYSPVTSNPNAVKAEVDGYVRVMLRVNDNAPAIYVSSALKKDKLVDLVVFAGQSNMAGRGVTSTEWPQTAPNVIPGAGYEFKSVTDPTKLYQIVEPFGYAENVADDESGIYDGTRKTGDMVPAFVNAYYAANGNVPSVCVSASEGGSSSIEWQPETGNNFLDLAARVRRTQTWLADNAYSIRHQYCAWCQGESDGDNIASGTETLEEYKTRALSIFSGLISLGMEKVLLIRIGHHNSGTSARYKAIIDWQTEEAKTNENLVLVSCDFAAMRAKGMMKDSFHYYQIGYNIAGHSAGVNSAFYASTGKEPTMYDPENDNLYYSHK